jgi:hypothetical protein
MGYTTDFKGGLSFSRPLTEKEIEFINEFSRTRRMGRVVTNLPKPKKDFIMGSYGVEGEFYIDDEAKGIIDYNRPPKTQPGLWCQWVVSEDGDQLEWDGGEKFYNYTEWLVYMVKNFFEPWGVKLNGTIEWRGEDWDDHGKIKVKKSLIKVGKDILFTPADHVAPVKKIKKISEPNELSGQIIDAKTIIINYPNQ